MKQLIQIVNYLFRCRHKHLTFPQSPVGKQKFGLTYIVCLDCGKEFGYDWQEMKAIEEIRKDYNYGKVTCISQ